MTDKTATGTASEDAARVKSLIEFAKGVLTARERVQMKMGDSQLGVFPQEKIEHLPGVFTSDDDGTWLRIRRQSESKPNAPVDYLKDFLDNDGSNPEKPPELKPAISRIVSIEEASDLAEASLLRPDADSMITEKGITREDVVRITLLAEDLHAMRNAHQRWIKDVWMPWAEQERPIRHSIALYNALFTIHSAIHASEGAPPEVIWGFGIGLWNLDGMTINMPLIEQEVEIEVLSGGDLIMTPRDRPMVLSLKPYLQLEVPNSARLQTKLTALLEQVRSGDAPVTPDDFKALEAILSTAATELHSAGRYLSGQDLPEGSARAEADLRVIDRWTIYVRPRSNAAAVQDLEQIAKRVERDGHAPAALKGFVAPEPDKSVVSDMFGLNSTALGATLAAPERSSGREEPESGLGAPREMSPEHRDKGAYFFPLPFNADQATIIDILEGRGKEKRSPVVSVTGPPGTGKSHTIANLVCHAMARGQRVLVTARTAEAISVVRDKLPSSLQNLVIASTGTDRESIEYLKSAVSELSDEIVALDVAAANRRREELEQAILECDDIAEMADKELSGIARANLDQINMDGEAHTPMELAGPVNQGRALHGWFDDRPGKPPLADLSTSLEVLRRELPRLAPDLNLAGTQLPSAEDLPTVADIIAAHRDEKIRVARPKLDPNDFPPMAINSTADLQTARDLAMRLDAIEQERSDLDHRQRALVEIAFGPDRNTLVSALQALNMMKMYSEGSAVRYGQELPLDELIQAAERGAAGQRPAPGFLNRKLKAAVATVVIDGGIATTADHWRAVLDIMRLEAEIGQIRTVLGKVPPAQDCLKGITRGWEACEALIPLRNDMQMAIKLSDGLRMTTREAEVFFPVDMDFKTCHRGDTRQLRDAIEANAPTAGGPHPAIATLSDLGSRGKHTLYARLDAMARALGTEDASPQDIIRERTELTQEIDRLSAVLGDIEVVNTHLETLERAGAPAWARRLKAHPADAETLIPDTWRAAWDWAMFAGRLDAIVALGNGDTIRSRKTNATRRREKLMIELIRVRTMLGLKGRMTSSVQRAMQAFTQAVSRVGRGTGKTAPRFRAAAQNAAKEVAVAAPVWIMPEHRIPEQLPPDLEAFDLVILDEASQSDVTAVAALARGRQVLVVGDEEQVSPSNVGIQRQKIDALRAEHLDGLPNADLIDENTSIFEITMRMYPESHVILREHFRCVAPIINFSAQFYNNRLIPLRIPLPSERFDPPLVDVFLDRAERIGQVNLSEARAIVEEIAVIVADPAHSQRDIGVVSLIGAEQAIEIEKRLLADARIGPDVMRERRIICGDARTMQGQERSVVFLSMVATPDRVTAQTKKDTQRRLNVAMSRAQDRVYLMRSVRNSDLKPSDLKLKVVQHFEDPMPEGSKISGIDLMDRCESGFEREVLGMLLDAGYRATPQKSAGKFRIDIVVEGAEDRRLAIELDGDAYHGPDRWADDMARQSALERAGWVFWRVFGSQWGSEKDRWWEDLRNTLAAMEIEPIGSEAVNDNFVEYRAFGSVIGETPDGTTDNAADEPNAETPIEPDKNIAPPPLGWADDIDPTDDSPEIAAASASGGIDARSGGPGDATEQAAEEDLAGIRPTTSKPSFTSPAIPVVLAAKRTRSAGKDRTADKSASAKRDTGASAIQADLFQTRTFGSVEISTGMVVKIEMDDGESREIVLVAKNSDAGTGRILPSSPLGEALMGSVAGEDIEFMIGRDLRTARILSVETEEMARAE